jgi:hypothetical protein
MPVRFYKGARTAVG